MKAVKEEYKNSFIYKVCTTLNIDLKELAFKMNKTHKCMENWRKDDSCIPALDKEFMKLLMQNQALKNEIIQFEKHKVILNELIESDEFGSSKLNFNLVNGTLKRLRKYRIILEEM